MPSSIYSSYTHYERERKARKRIGERLLVIMDRLYSLTEKQYSDIDVDDVKILEDIHKQLEQMQRRYR